MNRLNKTELDVFLIVWVLSVSQGSVFPDYLYVTTAVVVPREVGKTSLSTSI